MATKLEDAEGEIGSLQKTLHEQSSNMEYLLKTRAGGTILEFQEYRNRLMKRGRLLKRKSRKQSGRSLIWKSILSEHIEWKGKRNQRQLKNQDSPGPFSVACRTGNRRKPWLERPGRRNPRAYSFVKF